jgi:hypothetical protein
MGSNMVHGPTAQQTVTQHHDRFWNAHLYQRFPLTQKEFWFQPYIERPNPTPYVARASILVKSVSGIRGGVEVELDMDSSLVLTS